MKKYIQTLRSLISKDYKLHIYNGNNNKYVRPMSGNYTNLRLIRHNNQAELILHKKGNGVTIEYGYTNPNSQQMKYGTKIRALAVLAALISGIPLYQFSVHGKNSGSYKIMKKLGALNNTNSGVNHFMFIPNKHNLNLIRSYI